MAPELRLGNGMLEVPEVGFRPLLFFCLYRMPSPIKKFAIKNIERPRVLFVALLTFISAILLVPEFAATDDGWRRTVNGWEHMSDWNPHVPQYAPPRIATSIHPMVVASLELLVVAGIFVFFEKKG